MNLLYLSAHQTMEYDEIKCFHELGFKVFSVGYYLDPQNPVDSTREPLKMKVDQEWLELFRRLHPDFKPNTPIKLHREFVEKFDIIVVVHYAENFILNWELIKDKIVIRRSVAMNDGGYEARFKPFSPFIKTIRVSQKEETLPNYNGCDAVILGSVDPEEFKGWIGDEQIVLTIQKWMARHPIHTQFHIYSRVTEPFNRRLLGFQNYDIPWAVSDVPIEQLKKYLQSCRVYFASCARPAALIYTFQEALIMGCPVVTFGPIIGNFSDPSNGRMYQQHEYLVNGESGFWSDDIEELQGYIKLLLEDEDLARKISKNGREVAIKHFHPEKIKNDWRQFFNSIGITF